MFVNVKHKCYSLNISHHDDRSYPKWTCSKKVVKRSAPRLVNALISEERVCNILKTWPILFLRLTMILFLLEMTFDFASL